MTLRDLLILTSLAALSTPACSDPKPTEDSSDRDGDGWTSAEGDCDDDDPIVNPAATDAVDSASTDQNCDGEDGTDADDDGSASQASGGADCDDGDARVSPNANEICDGLDNDCDGVVDEDDAADAAIWYVDRDGDGAGDPTTTTSACLQPERFVSSGEDCDDEEVSRFPGANELCDGEDNDCDGLTDEADAADASAWYRDEDGDGFGDPDRSELACEPPPGFVATAGDCDDDDEAVSPEDAETPYDGLDNDCDTTTLDDDLDEDGFGDAALGGEDCDDGDASAWPAAEEICADGVVNDCEGDISTAMAACGMSGEMSLADADLKMIGESENDRAGSALASVGDTDGDGYDDLLIGAFRDDDVAIDAGAAYLVTGATASAATDPLPLADANRKLLGGHEDALAGRGVSGAGDPDGDGYADVLVGVYRDASAAYDAGAAYLVLGTTLSAADDPMSLPDADLQLFGEGADDYAGWAVAAAGDVDGDSLDDLLVGAYEEDSVGTDAGAAYLVLGSTVAAALAAGESALSLAEADWKLLGEQSEDQAGFAVASPGDLDGDGFAELLVGADGLDHSDGSLGVGASYLLFGGEDLGADGPRSLADADLRITGVVAYDSVGHALSGAGDVDGDGHPDLLLAAYGEDTGAVDGGAAWLLLASDLAWSWSGVDLSTDGVKITGEVSKGYAGYSVASAGDVDGDDRADVLVGAHRVSDALTDAGAAYLLTSAGALDGLSTGTVNLSAADLRLSGEASDDLAGHCLTGAGDVNADGFDDLLVGAYGDDSGGASAGAAYLIYGGGY